MTTDHGDIVRAAFDASALPTPPRPLTAALGFVTRLLSLLPPSESAGYCKGPAGGENVSPLPDGTLVRISRICYPDGQIYKVMSDAPNGNPQWVPEDVRADLYIPFGGTHTAPDVPPPVDDLGPLLARLNAVERQTEALSAAFAEVSRQIGTLNSQLADLTNKPTPALPPLPDYIGTVRVFGYTVTIISRPRT